MTQRPRVLKHVLVAAAILLLCVGGYYRVYRLRGVAASIDRRHYTETFFVMGTMASVQFWEEDQNRSREAAGAVRRVFQEVNDRFSNYQPESELSRLNAGAAVAPFACSDEMWDLLQHARLGYALSDKAFDVSVAPLVALWGIYRKELKTPPTPAAIEAARRLVGLDKVEFDDARKTVRFTVPGMALDFGGIAKGYAVDLAADALRQQGIRRGIIDLGGNIYCFPEPPPDRDCYRIAVRDPRAPFPETRTLGYVALTDLAIGTSGDYERFVEADGKRYGHILDPRTGLPVAGMASVTIIARRAVVTEYLSKHAFVNNGRDLAPLLQRFPELNVLIIRRDDTGKLTMEKFPATGNVWEQVAGLEQWDQLGDIEPPIK